MCAVCMTSNTALGTLATVLASKRKHVSTVAAPVGPHVGERFEPMWNAMVNLFLVTILSEGSIDRDRKIEKSIRTPAEDLDMHFVTTFS